MIGREARLHFERFLADRGRAASSLTVDDAFDVMVAFYREVRADDCPIPDDGDMLLFQSGADGSAFEWSITRQLIPEGDPDPGEVWQLELQIRPSAEVLATLSLEDGDGDATEFCESPSALDDFVALVATHPATVALRSLGAVEVRLRFDNAE